MAHHVLNNKPDQRVVQKTLHIQNANSLNFRYDEFVLPFQVPASKYLKLYLRLFLLNSMLSSEPDIKKLFGGIE